MTTTKWRTFSSISEVPAGWWTSTSTFLEAGWGTDGRTLGERLFPSPRACCEGCRKVAGAGCRHGARTCCTWSTGRSGIWALSTGGDRCSGRCPRCLRKDAHEGRNAGRDRGVTGGMSGFGIMGTGVVSKACAACSFSTRNLSSRLRDIYGDYVML